MKREDTDPGSFKLSKPFLKRARYTRDSFHHLLQLFELLSATKIKRRCSCKYIQQKLNELFSHNINIKQKRQTSFLLQMRKLDAIRQAALPAFQARRNNFPPALRSRS